MNEKEPVYIKVFIDYLEAIEPLMDDERGRLFTALLAYAQTGEVPELPGNERFVFPMMKLQLDRDFTSITGKSRANSANGKKGGAPKGNQNAKKRQSAPETTQTTENNRPETTQTTQTTKTSETSHDKDDDNDNDYDNDDDKTSVGAKMSSAAGMSASANADREVMARFLEFLPGASEETRERMTEYCRKLGAEVCLRAIDVARDAAPVARNRMAYLFGILRNREADGIRSGADWDAHERERSQRSRDAPPGRGQKRDVFSATLETDICDAFTGHGGNYDDW